MIERKTASERMRPMDISITGYDIECKIGEGGMAEVYRARHLRLDRVVALKVLANRYSDEPGFAERFLREARIAASLNHPNIVQIYDVDKANGKLFLSMELVVGGDLSEKLTRRADKDFVISVFSQLCNALDYAHGKGYIHRDIKPANILFREDDSLALSDFGIAKAMRSDTNMTRTGLAIGTPSYMSPEQAQSFTLDGRSDLYSTGVIAFQFITGQLPYKADSSISMAIKHISDPIPSLPGQLAVMQPFFNKALAKKPEERFATGKDFVNAFAVAMQQIDTNSYTEFTTQLMNNPVDDSNTLMRMGDESNPSNITANAATKITPKTKKTKPAPTQVSAAGDTAPQKNKSPLLFLFGAAAVTALFAVGVYVYNNNGNSTPTTAQVQLSPAAQIRLGQLLTAADKAMAANRLVEPEGDNAYEYYLAIMALSPDDPVAIDGVEQIRQKLTEQAEQAIAATDLTLAEKYIAKLQSTKADPQTYATLQENIDQQRQDMATQVDAQLANIQQLLDAGAVGNALEEVANIKKQTLTDSQSSLLRQTLTFKAQADIEQAKRASAANQFTTATTQLDEAQRLAAAIPNSQIVKEVEQLRSSNSAKQRELTRDRQTQEFLRNGDTALAAGNLVAPQMESAWHYYAEALQREPGNADALIGQQNVKQAVVNKINGAIDTGNGPVATASIRELETIDSRHPELSQLKKRWETKQRSMTRNQAQLRKINELYSRAETYLNRDRADGADKVYADIIRLDPNEPRLQELGRKIADGYVTLAQREIDANDWKDVHVWVERGLAHVPDHQKLLEQQALANEKIQQGCASLLNFKC